VNVIARFRVRVLPVIVRVLPPTDTAHRLFCSVVDVPSVAELQTLPPSSSRWRRFADRL
jgi:hypothetical protein